MQIQIIIFVTIVLAIIVGAHYYAFISIAAFFSVTGLLAKRLLFFLPLFFSLSFIITSIMTRYFGNGLVKYLYYLSAIWLGIMNYILVAVTVVWIIIGLGKLLGLAPNQKLLASTLFVFVLLIVGYGLYNARRPVINNIDVTIKNLPEFWRGKTAVQISDIHLGANKRTPYMANIAQEINRLNPDIIFITGDYFDGTCPYLDIYANELKKLSPPEGMVFINGNHETYEGLDRIRAALKDIDLIYLEDELVNIKGLNILGLAYPTRGLGRDISGELKKLEPNEPNILLYHEPRYIKEAQAAGVNLQLAGHTHQGQFWPHNFFTWLIYKKYHHGLYTDGDYTIYTTSGTGVWGPPLRIGTKPEIVVIHFN